MSQRWLVGAQRASRTLVTVKLLLSMTALQAGKYAESQAAECRFARAATNSDSGKRPRSSSRHALVKCSQFDWQASSGPIELKPRARLPQTLKPGKQFQFFCDAGTQLPFKLRFRTAADSRFAASDQFAGSTTAGIARWAAARIASRTPAVHAE